MRDGKTVLVILLLVLCIAIAGRIDFDTEVRQGDAITNNGSRITVAKVIDIEGNRIIVEIDRDLYAFYGDGFEEGKVISVEITKDNEIISAKKW